MPDCHSERSEESLKEILPLPLKGQNDKKELLNDLRGYNLIDIKAYAIVSVCKTCAWRR